MYIGPFLVVPEICLRIENMLKKIEEAAEVSERTERVLNLSEADWEVINKDSIEEREVSENMKKELTLSLPGVYTGIFFGGGLIP